jgi:hypothetical protein
MTDKEYLALDAFKLIEAVWRGKVQDGVDASALDEWLARAERCPGFPVRIETTRRREKCEADGHPNAEAVSAPVPDHTEYLCRACNKYFLRKDAP